MGEHLRLQWFAFVCVYRGLIQLLCAETEEYSAYLVLSNIESIPNSAAEAPVSGWFILAFVGTIGASSYRGLCEVACMANVDVSTSKHRTDTEWLTGF